MGGGERPEKTKRKKGVGKLPAAAAPAGVEDHRSSASSSPAGSFTISIKPIKGSVSQGGEAEYEITIRSVGGFDGTVNLSIALPAGCTLAVPPAPVKPAPNGSASSTFSMRTSSATPLGSNSFNVNGRSGRVRKRASAEITVTP